MNKKLTGSELADWLEQEAPDRVYGEHLAEAIACLHELDETRQRIADLEDVPCDTMDLARMIASDMGISCEVSDRRAERIAARIHAAVTMHQIAVDEAHKTIGNLRAQLDDALVLIEVLAKYRDKSSLLTADEALALSRAAGRTSGRISEMIDRHAIAAAILANCEDQAATRPFYVGDGVAITNKKAIVFFENAHGFDADDERSDIADKVTGLVEKIHDDLLALRGAESVDLSGISVPDAVTCPSCNGSGEDELSKAVDIDTPCCDCLGAGRKLQPVMVCGLVINADLLRPFASIPGAKAWKGPRAGMLLVSFDGGCGAVMAMCNSLGQY